MTIKNDKKLLEGALMPLNGKMQPMVLESEEYVLGAILLEKNAMAEAVDLILPEMFYREENKNTYLACLNLYARNSPIDLVSVKVELQRIEMLDLVGGPLYLTDLLSKVASSVNIGYHCKLIVEKFILRRLGQLGVWMFNKMYEPTVDVFELLSDVEGLIFKLTQQNVKQEMVRFESAVDSELQEITNRYRNKGKVYGIPSGFHDIDVVTGNFKGSEFILIAARPSMGKTILGLNIAKNISKYQKKSVAVFSLEMSKSQLMQRIIAEETGVDLKDLQSGSFSSFDLESIERIMNEIKGMNLSIDDTAGISLFELRTKCRKIKAELGLDMVVIDYIQLMKVGDSKPNRNREQEVGEISRGLKQLSKELNVPVIALAQLSRAVEQRQDKRPVLSDLRESGSLEMDADMVMMLYRPEYYKIPEDENGESTAGIGHVLVVKNRNGELGDIKMAFHGSRFRFESLSNQGQQSFKPSERLNDAGYTRLLGEREPDDPLGADTAPF
jgi:replicative DNA helicase